MEEIIWLDDYSVGEASLDEQHKTIIQLINTLLEHKNSSPDSTTLPDVASKLLSYSKKHLIYEESLLEKYKYPDLIKHKELHKIFFIRAKILSFSIVSGNNVTAEDALDFLYNWWYQHILYEDRSFKQFFEGLDISNHEL